MSGSSSANSRAARGPSHSAGRRLGSKTTVQPWAAAQDRAWRATAATPVSAPSPTPRVTPETVRILGTPIRSRSTSLRLNRAAADASR